jgi:uroporphyrinogen-III decarboxylase
MCQLAIGHYLLNTDVKPAELWFSSEGFARALVELQRRYRFDGILINLPGRRPDWRRGMKAIEDTREGQVVHWNNGDITICPWDDNAHHRRLDKRTGNHALDTELRPGIGEVDPELIFYDDPHTEGGLKYPFHYGLEEYRPDPSEYFPPWHFRTIDLVLEEAGAEVSVHGEYFSPFTQMMELLGYQSALAALIEEPAKCRLILDRYAEGCAAFGRAIAERGVDAIIMSSAFAGAGFISKQMYEEFVLPHERKAATEIKKAYPDVAIYTHTCGAVGDRLELMAETGVDGIDCLDPPPLGTVELPDAKARIGHRLFIKGNIDPVNTLLKKTRDEVREDAGWRLQVAKEGGGYILSSACSVPPRAPAENLAVLAEAAEEWGRYD